MKKRDKLHALSNNQPFNTKIKQDYKKYRNKLNNLIDLAKTSYLKKQVEEAKGDKKKIWEIINDVTQYKKKKTNNIKGIEIQGDYISVDKDPIKVANHFNNFFANLGSKTTRTQPQSPNIPHLPTPQTHDLSSFYLKPINEKELDDIISKMKGGSAPGHDKIDTGTIKSIKQYILKPLTFIYNLCFKTGTFPRQFKISIISPLHKKGDPCLVSNFRPISLLSIFSKILERCIKSRLVKYLDENGILSDLQFGFRSGRDTNDAVLELTEEIYPHLDGGGKVAACLMDLSQAFVKVDHAVLIKNLDRIGIKEKPLELFKSYLTGRSQQVKLRTVSAQQVPTDSFSPSNTDQSDRVITTHLSDSIANQPFSVPQGTVLSPVLYNIYVCDMYNLPLAGKVISYADDTALIMKGVTWTEVFQNMRKDMQLITKWLDERNLSLNVEKTKILPFCLNKKTFPTKKFLRINPCTKCTTACMCNKVEITESIRYLGVQLDCHLRWEYHIENLRNRLRRYIHPFLALRKFMALPMLKEIYYALIQSALEYGICAYGRADSSYLKKLKSAQNILLKIIHKKIRLFPSERLYKELKVLNIDRLFKKNLCSHVHKNKDKLLRISEHRHNIRRRNLLVPKCKTKKGQKSITYLGIKMYESIPQDIQQIGELKNFKFKLKHWLMENNNID